jgi:hypothetical protein
VEQERKQNRSEHYRQYAALREEVEAIFGAFRPNMDQGELGLMVREHEAIPRRTFYGWHAHWLRDPEWRPYAARHGGNRFVFSGADESELMRQLERTYWFGWGRLSSRTFKQMVVRFWRLRRRTVRRQDRFTASSHFRVGSAGGIVSPCGRPASRRRRLRTGKKKSEDLSIC